MSDNVNNNPFAGLFPSINDAVSFSAHNQSQAIIDTSVAQLHDKPVDKAAESGKSGNFEAEDSKDESTEESVIDDVLADIFGITLKETGANGRKRRLVFTDVDSIEEAVFERLLLPDLESKLVPKSSETCGQLAVNRHTTEKRAIPYLFESYCRALHTLSNPQSSNIIRRVKQIILQNASVAFQQPKLFDGQKIHRQFVQLCTDRTKQDSELSSFITGIVSQLQEENETNDDETIVASFAPILDIVYKEATGNSQLPFRPHWFTILNIFCSTEPLAKLVIEHSTPKANFRQSYQDTLLGALFAFDYSSSSISSEMVPVVVQSLRTVVLSLLKCSTEVRHLTLQWLGDCLQSNANRGKIWNVQNDLGIGSMTYVSDSFMLNLGYVLVGICQPFCGDQSVKQIDPTYCAAEVKDRDEGASPMVHLKGLSSESCLIPTPEGERRPVAKSFGFTTECFFLTHRALDLGYRVVFEKLLRTNQALARIERAYRIAERPDVRTTQRLQEHMTKSLYLRRSLLVPEMFHPLAMFHATTADWLVQVCLSEAKVGEGEQNDYIPKECKPVVFPLPETIPDTFRCIPEFVVENTMTFLDILHHLNPDVFEEEGSPFLTPVLTMIIVLMESEERLYNPHLRARLAEGLEALLPMVDQDTMSSDLQSISAFCREKLFLYHPYRQYIVPNLLKVFVSIEMTGQSVQFEQKFNYRRPMYVVMEYLWKLPEHCDIFIALAEEAEANMEAAQPPLFLRFINLLMNDAAFLMDEALSSMAQLKQLIQARESGEWNKLPQHERDQQADYLLHLAMIARFDNILGRKTIETLTMFTLGIKSLFCHPTMVDRIAAMLNYLLLQLVGPNQKNLKVNDEKEFAFKPGLLVEHICTMYINLSKCEPFRLAVSQDGRSYSPQLFKWAYNVLVRIGCVSLLSRLEEFARDVEAAASQKKEEDKILVDAPDDFLDPIMSTLMTDPVILPSSRITIDRQTIARHLLSNQTDPFNRSPLTMDMVKPDVELRWRVQEWIQRKKRDESCE